MAIDCIQALTEEYANALQDYCLNPDCLNTDRTSSTAQHLGERAAAAGLTMTALVHLYQQALDTHLQTMPAHQDGVRIAKLSSDFLAQSLLPFEQQWQQTERALRRSEEQFRTIFDHAAIGIVVTDRNQRIAHANPFFQNALQYSAAELAEFDFIQVTHPDDVAQEQTLVNECLAGTRNTYRLEKRYLRKDGAVIWSDMTGTVVRDAIGHIQYSIVTMTDTTAQRAALQEREQVETALQLLNTELESRVWERTAALEQKNAELEALFRIFPDSFFKIAADGTYLDCRGQSPQDFYLPPEELIGRKVQDVLPAPMGQQFQAMFQDVLQRDAIVNVEYALTITGAEQHYEARLVPIQPNQIVAIVRNISDRKRLEADRQLAQETLRQNEERFRRIAANLPGMVYQYMTRADGSAVYTYVSPGCQQVCEVEPAAVLADPTILWRMTHPDDVPSLQQAVAVSMATMQPLHHEHRLITPAGQIKWVQLNSQRERLANGDVIADGVAIDITSRKLAEAALYQSEARFHQLADNIPGAFYQSVILPDGSRQFTYLSSGYERVFEAAPAVLLADADSFWHMVHPDDIAPLREEVRRSLAAQEPFQFEYRIITPSGRIKWLHNVASRQQLPNGDIISDGVVLDITDRKTAEIALQTSEQNFRTIFNHVSSDIWVYDVDGTVLDVNDRVLKHSGLTREAALQISLLDHYASAELPLVFDRLQRALAGEIVQFEWQARHPSTGAVIELDIVLSRIIWNGQTVLLTDVRDITDRKQAEAALEISEQNFRTIFNHVSSDIWVHDVDGTVLDVNDRALKHLGLTRAEALQLLLLDRHPSAARPFAYERWQRALAGEIVQFEWQTSHPSTGAMMALDIALNRITWNGRTVILADVRDITDRKTAEAALQASEQNFRTIFNHVSSHLWVHTVDGTVLDANDRVLKHIGLTRTEAQQVSLLDFYAPAERPLALARWQQALDGETVQFEFQSHHFHKGAVAELDITLNRILWNGQTVILSNIQDITDRKRNEAARAQVEQALRSREAELRRDRALFAGVFENSADALFLVSPLTSCIVHCNQRAVELFEVNNREHLIGMVGSTFHKEPFQPADRAAAIAATETIGGWSQEIEYVTHRGNPFWGDCTAKRIQVDGETLHLVRVTDISDRKAAAAALQTSEQNLRTIFNNVSHKIWVHDVEGNLLAVNDRVLEEVKQDRSPLMQRSVLDHSDPSIHAILKHHWQRAFAGEMVHFEIQAPHLSNGTRVDLDITLNRIVWDGRAVILANVQNVTDRKEAGRQLQYQAETAQLLATIVQTINQSIQLEPTLAICLEQTRQFLQCDRVLIGRFDADDAIFIEREAVSQPTLSLLGQTFYDPCFGQAWAERYRQGHIAARHDILTDATTGAIAPCYADFLAQIQVKASLTVAILQADQLWGLLIVHHCTAPHQWQSSEADLLQQLGLQIGIASQKANLYTQLEAELAERRRAEYTIAQQVQRERLLRTISQQIRQSLRLDQILATTVTEIRRLLAADRAIIFRLNRDRSGVVIQEANLGKYPIVMEMYLTDRHFPQDSYDFYLTGQVRAVDRASDDAPSACLVDFMERIGVKSKLVAPILQTLEDDTPIVWGLLIVHACEAYRHWQPTEVVLLQQLATQVGIAIQQANLYTQIKNELTQKEVLLKEIHHRVKNNLQVVSALLTLQADSIQDPTVLAALQDSDNRLQAMALIHETLYQSNNLGRLNFSNYLQRLTDNILLANSRHLNAISLTYELEPVFLNLDTAIPCGLLLNELVTNAIKHAFPNGRQGTICLSLQCAPKQPTPPLDPSSAIAITTGAILYQEAPRYILSISDDGIGIPANLNLSTIKSLGLRIASDLAQQLRGSLVLERHHGTQFHLTFADLSYLKRL